MRALAFAFAFAASVVVVVVTACGPAPSPAHHGADLRVLLPGAVECAAGGSADDCTFDFGIVGGTEPPQHAFDVVNVGDVDATVANVDISGSPNFTIDGAGDSNVFGGHVAAGDTALLVIDADPASGSVENATVALRYLSRDDEAVIALNVSAARAAGPQPVVTGACDFGDVTVGQQSAPCVFTITNDGGAELELDNITTAPVDVFQPGGVFAVPSFIQAGESLDVAFIATPQQLGARNGNIVFSFQDGALFSTVVTVTGI